MSNLMMKERICQGVSEWTGQPCGAQAVNENTVRKGTRTFLDPKFCQMHQPGKLSKKKCVCPHCHYHRTLKPVASSGEPEVLVTRQEDVELHESENMYGIKKKTKRKYTKRKK